MCQNCGPACRHCKVAPCVCEECPACDTPRYENKDCTVCKSATVAITLRDDTPPDKRYRVTVDFFVDAPSEVEAHAHVMDSLNKECTINGERFAFSMGDSEELED